ncbi:unnamed protein product, partial [Hermetia illucens]
SLILIPDCVCRF